MNRPKISVLMSVYEEPIDWLKQSIDSILQQTFGEFEFIIICDNPCYDNGVKLIQTYAQKDNRIVPIFNEHNIGLTKSLNRGLAIARGEYIARMDADDISLPSRLKKQLDYLNDHPQCCICGSNFIYMGARSGLKQYPEDITMDSLFLESPFAHPTVMIRSEFLEETKYNEDYRVSQDFELWSRLLKEGFYYHNIQEALLHYRCSEKQIMSIAGSLQAQLSRNIRRNIVTKYALKYEDKFVFPKDVSFEFKRKLCKMPLLINDKKYLLFCLYTSIDASATAKLWNMLKDGDLFFMDLKSILRVLKYSLYRIDASKF